ncbi:MAG: hypothetical protein QG588_47 [Candidatus Poribacteria bacterium]|nr:hypothetical protein [Candidatus Poribacteria bacterium]
MTLIFQANAEVVKGIRYYSESEKTRVVILTKNITPYKTQLDLQNNVSIYLQNSELEDSSRSFKIGDGLVKAVSLKGMKDNTVEVKIMLEKQASFNVFPLESPSRIVIDITPVGNILAPEIATISSKSETIPKMLENKITPAPIQKAETTKSIVTKKSSENNEQVVNITEVSLGSNFSFSNIKILFSDENYVMIQIAFDMVMLAMLIYMIIKMKTVLNFTRFIKKHKRLLKGNKAFADMLVELENGYTHETEINKHKQVSKVKNADDEKKEKTNKDTNTEKTSVSKQYEKVYEMAQRGIDPISISQKNNIPIGEVNLILDLIKSKREGFTNS